MERAHHVKLTNNLSFEFNILKGVPVEETSQEVKNCRIEIT